MTAEGKACEGRAFEGKVCVVTGGTQGVGAAVARFFASQGAAGIVTCGRDQVRGNAVRDGLVESGTPTLFVTARLEDEADCCSVIAEAEGNFGRVDVLVNAGGSTRRGSIMDSTAAEIDEVFAVNVRGPMVLMREAMAIMRREGNGGSVVNVSSVVASGGPDFLCAYAASKAALETVTRNAAYAVVRDRIRVNAINPVIGETALTAEFMGGDTPELRKSFVASVPLGRMSRPTDIANAALYLVSDEAEFITGVCLEVDGGRCI